MKNFFLLIILLWIGILHAQNQNFLLPQEASSIDIPANAVRKLIETENFTTTLNFCDLSPDDNYIISIIPADNHSCNANLFLDQHRIAVNDSHRLEFTALSECEQVKLSNTCGAISSTYYYVSILNKSKKKDASLTRSMGIMTAQQDASSLVTDVFLKGDCVVIENITYQGHNSAIGSFSGGDFAIGIEEGIIITSGAVNLASGPNIETGATAPWGDDTGDPDLEGTAGDAIMDAAVLEFDFTPTGDMVSFDFVFASEEYCDFVNAAFNDAFGFYLTGPGHNGTNIARVNGPGSPPASINSVNHLSNSQYYVDNVPPTQQQFQACVNHTPTPGPLNSQIEYDGFTVKLTAVADVEPCVPYHIKLAVGDAVDDFFDSAVFLGANSFDAASLVTIEGVVASGDPTAIEGCDDAFLVFTRENIPITEGVELTYTITDNSTATAGVDYEALSGSVTINPGSYQVQVPVIIIPDDLDEGTEIIELELSTSLCDGLCEQIQLTTITIEDGIPLDVSFPPIPTCGESSVTLSPSIGDGSGDYVYTWSDGTTSTSLDVDLTDTPTTYSVTVTDNSNCAAGVATVELSGGAAPEASIEGEAQICEEPADEIFLVTFTGNGPWTLEYSIDGSPQDPITDITDNPYELFASELGTYTLESISANNCPGITSGSATIELTEFFLIPDASDVSCGGESDGVASIAIDGGTAPYIIQWSNGGTEEEITDLPAGSYSVIVTDDNGCFSEAFVDIEEPFELEAEAMLSSQPDCDNPMGGEASLSVNGGIQPYTFAWDNGTSDQNLTGVSGGTYTVLVTDDSGCTTMATVEVPSGGELPEAFATAPGDISCAEPEITLSGSGTSDGTYLWTTDDGNIVGGETTLTPDVDQAGTYTLTVTTTDGCMASESVTIAGDASVPVAIADAPEDELNCNSSLLNLDGSNSSLGNEYTYLWTTNDGNIVDGADTDSPSIDEAGTYTLTVLNTTNNCEASADVTITENLDEPDVDATEQATLTCGATSVSIEAFTSINNPSYQWYLDDMPLNGETDAILDAMQSGTYTVEVTDPNNGCVGSDISVVSQDDNVPSVMIEAAENLTCATTSLILDATNSDNGTDFSYEWVASNDGNILSGASTLMPEVDATGTYTLTITNNLNNCTSTDFIEISETITPPVAVAAAPNQLDCSATQVSLTGEGSDTGTNISYLWSTPNGVIISDETTLSPTVGAVGEYILTVTNNDTGCSETATAMVDENEDLPNAEIADALALDCNLATLDLDATASDNGPDYSFNWDVENGGVISAGATTLTPTITEPGTYLLTITDNNSNCESITSITIAENVDEPEITPGTDYTLTCGENSLVISASTTVVSPDYQWMTEDGTPIAGATAPDLEVMASGIYTLMVTDTNNGCSNTANISVGQDDNTPSVSIANANPLTCDETSAILDATASDNGTDFSYEWVASNGGNITSGDTTLMPQIDATGTYTLTITNTINNCTSTDFIEITETVTPPIAVAAAPNQLSCTETEVPLTGDGSEMGANISYLWSTPNGVIISDETTLSPTVGAVGEYILTVTNNDTGCSETASTMVDENDDLPNAEIADALPLDCNVMSQELDATASDNGANYSFNWDVENGGVISAGATTLTPTITEPGTYLLTITDNTSNCESITSITIAQNIAEPDVTTANTNYILTCGENSVTISASTSVPNPSYQWMTEDGAPIAGATAPDLEVMSSGIYTVMVTDMNNGCSNTTNIPVEQDDNIPTIMIADPNPLTCATTTMVLDATASDNGNDFMYSWIASDGGIILSGETTLMPEVSATGTYTLEITNSTNGCSSTDFTTVIEETMPPTAEAGLTLQFACGDTEATLDGTGSDEGATYTYLWTTSNGVIDNGETTLMPTVSAPGIYTITVMNTENGCTSSDEIEITQDTNAPTAIAGTAESLTCTVTSVTLDGSASSTGAEFTYLWTTTDGTIDNGETSLMPEVSATGTYILTVTNSSNNCTTSSSVTVEINDTQPNVAIAQAGNLTCGESSVVIDGSGSDNGANFSPVWTTLGGNIVSGANTYMPTVDVAGTYILEITDSTNGCSNTSSVEVEVDGDTPTVVIATADQLTCNLMMLQLNANGSDFGDNFAISWSTDTGNFVEGEETLTPTIDAPGNYTLSITNNNNGCTDASNILIEENTTTAAVNAGQTQTLDCTVTSLQLEGTTDMDTGNIAWTTNNGNILSGATSLNPTVNSAGTYTLTITNPDNGCTSSADVTIALDPSVPEVIIATPTMLTCDVTSFTLDASETTSDQDLIFQWTSTNGNIISGADTPNPMIDAPGNYVLTIFIGDNCSNTSAIEVIEDTETPTANAGTDFTINCTEPESSLDASNSSIGTNFSYQWETTNGTLVSGSETPQPNISGGGLYTLTIMNTTNGCTATDAVTVIDDAPESIQAQVTDPDCFNPIGSFGVSGVNGGTAPYVYSIDGGATFQNASNFSNLESGIYDFVVQDANDCTYEESFEISANTELNLTLEPLAKISFGESYQIQALINIPLDQIESIQWSPVDSLISCIDCLSTTVQPLETTTYFISIIDINGCEVSSSIDVIVDKRVPIYIPNAFSPGGVQNEAFTIHADSDKIKNINVLQVFNRWGELVFENFDFAPNNFEAGWNGTFAGEKLNPAVFVYWTEIELQDGRVIQMKGDVSIIK